VKVTFAAKPEAPAPRNPVALRAAQALELIRARKLSNQHLTAAGFQSPDEVMDVLARAGRNDPCPCGSGRKTKHCHR
jgi:uncharacterized protein YecA (UPF0149 family)